VRVETIPLIIGVLLALIGVGLIADAWLPEQVLYRSERRRRARAERNAGGEAAIGFGVVCMAAALIGRDTWPYSTVAVIAGALLIVVGAWLSRSYLRERISNRGALRRGAPKAKPREPRERIR
jgi:energy-converting hydrogenase Eha subunit A